jgi:2-oxoisovalerate dehydrogenase E1 component
MLVPAKKISASQALDLYRKLLLPRLIEEKMLSLLRQNKISKWFSGIGQEAISVGTVLSLSQQDYILPMHRNLGVFTTRGVPLYSLFCQLFGRAESFTGGRDRSFHFGIPEYRIFGMISHLAATMPVADGIALAQKLKDTKSGCSQFLRRRSHQ